VTFQTLGFANKKGEWKTGADVGFIVDVPSEGAGCRLLLLQMKILKDTDQKRGLNGKEKEQYRRLRNIKPNAGYGFFLRCRPDRPRPSMTGIMINDLPSAPPIALDAFDGGTVLMTVLLVRELAATSQAEVFRSPTEALSFITGQVQAGNLTFSGYVTNISLAGRRLEYEKLLKHDVAFELLLESPEISWEHYLDGPSPEL